MAAAKSFCQSFKRFFKAPWEITGPCADPQYRIALPKATAYRRFCPATAPAKLCIPTANPETVFDIKYYYSRDRRRHRPPIRRTPLKKADVEKMMMAEKTFGAADFAPVYLLSGSRRTITPGEMATRNRSQLSDCTQANRSSALFGFISLPGIFWLPAVTCLRPFGLISFSNQLVDGGETGRFVFVGLYEEVLSVRQKSVAKDSLALSSFQASWWVVVK